jgi:tetratricopeptide (TPR) repeat protein
MVTTMIAKRIRPLSLGLLLLGLQAQAAGETPWQRSYKFETEGRYDHALAEITPLQSQAGSSELAWLRSGWLHYLQGNHNDAIRAYNQAMRLNTDSVDARLGLTLPLMAQQRWNDAAYYARHVIASDPGNYAAQLRLLVCLEALGQWDELKTSAQTASQHFPAEYLPWLYRARAHKQLRETSDMRQAYAQLLMRKPDDAEALAGVK